MRDPFVTKYVDLNVAMSRKQNSNTSILAVKFKSKDKSPRPYYCGNITSSSPTTHTGREIRQNRETKICNYEMQKKIIEKQLPHKLDGKLFFYSELSRLNALCYTHLYNFEFENKLDYIECLEFAKIFNIVIYDEKYTLSLINDYCLQ